VRAVELFNNAIAAFKADWPFMLDFVKAHWQFLLLLVCLALWFSPVTGYARDISKKLDKIDFTLEDIADKLDQLVALLRHRE
jgi:hypothetical protein